MVETRSKRALVPSEAAQQDSGEPLRKKSKTASHRSQAPQPSSSSEASEEATSPLSNSKSRSTSQKPRAEGSSSPPAQKRTRWKEDEKDALIQLFENGWKQGKSNKVLYKRYLALCVKKKWRKRSRRACEEALAKSGSRQQKALKWSEEELMLLKAMRDEGASVHTIFEALGGSRSESSISSKLHRLLPGPAAGVLVADANMISLNVGDQLSSGRAYWTEQEDEVLQKHVASGCRDFVLIRSELQAVVRKERLPVQDRTTQAIKKRIIQFTRNCVPPRRVRGLWTSDHDKLVEDAISAKKIQKEAVKAIAEKTNASVAHVIRRWVAIRRARLTQGKGATTDAQPVDDGLPSDEDDEDEADEDQDRPGAEDDEDEQEEDSGPESNFEEKAYEDEEKGDETFYVEENAEEEEEESDQLYYEEEDEEEQDVAVDKSFTGSLPATDKDFGSMAVSSSAIRSDGHAAYESFVDQLRQVEKEEAQLMVAAGRDGGDERSDDQQFRDDDELRVRGHSCQDISEAHEHSHSPNGDTLAFIQADRAPLAKPAKPTPRCTTNPVTSPADPQGVGGISSAAQDVDTRASAAITRDESASSDRSPDLYSHSSIAAVTPNRSVAQEDCRSAPTHEAADVPVIGSAATVGDDRNEGIGKEQAPLAAASRDGDGSEDAAETAIVSASERVTSPGEHDTASNEPCAMEVDDSDDEVEKLYRGEEGHDGPQRDVIVVDESDEDGDDDVKQERGGGSREASHARAVEAVESTSDGVNCGLTTEPHGSRRPRSDGPRTRAIYSCQPNVVDSILQVKRGGSTSEPDLLLVKWENFDRLTWEPATRISKRLINIFVHEESAKEQCAYKIERCAERQVVKYAVTGEQETLYLVKWASLPDPRWEIKTSMPNGVVDWLEKCLSELDRPSAVAASPRVETAVSADVGKQLASVSRPTTEATPMPSTVAKIDPQTASEAARLSGDGVVATEVVQGDAGDGTPAGSPSNVLRRPQPDVKVECGSEMVGCGEREQQRAKVPVSTSSEEAVTRDGSLPEAGKGSDTGTRDALQDPPQAASTTAHLERDDVAEYHLRAHENSLAPREAVSSSGLPRAESSGNVVASAACGGITSDILVFGGRDDDRLVDVVAKHEVVVLDDSDDEGGGEDEARPASASVASDAQHGKGVKVETRGGSFAVVAEELGVVESILQIRRTSAASDEDSVLVKWDGCDELTWESFGNIPRDLIECFVEQEAAKKASQHEIDMVLARRVVKNATTGTNETLYKIKWRNIPVACWEVESNLPRLLVVGLDSARQWTVDQPSSLHAKKTGTRAPASSH